MSTRLSTDFDRIEGAPLSEEDIERQLIETVSSQAFAAAETRMRTSASRSPLRKCEKEGGPGLKALFATLRQSLNDEADMTTLMAAAGTVLVAERARWPCKELQHPASAAQPLPVDPAVRRDVGLSGIGRWPQPVVAVRGQTVNGFARQELALRYARHSEKAFQQHRAEGRLCFDGRADHRKNPCPYPSRHRRSASRTATGLSHRVFAMSSRAVLSTQREHWVGCRHKAGREASFLGRWSTLR